MHRGNGRQEDERAADDHLVGEGVEDSPQPWSPRRISRVVAVEPIRARGDHEQHEGRQSNARPGDQAEQHHRQEQPQAGQLVGQVEQLREAAIGSWMVVWASSSSLGHCHTDKVIAAGGNDFAGHDLAGLQAPAGDINRAVDFRGVGLGAPGQTSGWSPSRAIDQHVHGSADLGLAPSEGDLLLGGQDCVAAGKP